MKKYLSKKKIIIAILILIILIIVFVIPIRCSDIVVTERIIGGDLGISEASRSCYSIYHKSFWNEMRSKPTEFGIGMISLDTWVSPIGDHYWAIPVGQHPHVQQTIFLR